MSGEKLKRSPKAAQALVDAMGDTMMSFSEVDDAQGETDCPDGCFVEPDGVCPHGWLSAARTLGIV